MSLKSKGMCAFSNQLPQKGERCVAKSGNNVELSPQEPSLSSLYLLQMALVLKEMAKAIAKLSMSRLLVASTLPQLIQTLQSQT